MTMPATIDAEQIAANRARVRARIARAAERAGRNPESVRLIAVSKTFPADAVIAAHAAGQRLFGENRVQEAVAKAATVREAGIDDVDWHLIGRLQTNKARAAADLFAMIHSVDSQRLAQALAARATGRLPVLIEVNAGDEASKAGFALDEAREAVAAIRTLPQLEVQGLMTVAPPAADPEALRPLFRGLADLARELALPELSMGMSGDFEVAVEEGATLVRVGSAIFGERERHG
jgi:pyridoxal phosphate enzyme (YggS family)